MIPIDPADDQDALAVPRPRAAADRRASTFVRPGAVAWGASANGNGNGQLPGEAVEQALAAAATDPGLIDGLLDEISRARLWLPLPAGEGPVTDGSAVMLPTVSYLSAEFVPAFTSEAKLVTWRAQADGEPVAHIAVGAAELARLLPPGIGIAINPGAPASLPVYPEGVARLAAAHAAVDGMPVRIGHPPAEPVALLHAVGGALRDLPAVRSASRAWLRMPGRGEGLVISVALDDPADIAAHDGVVAMIEQAVARQAPFPIDVTFSGAAEPDSLDDWLAGNAPPFYIREG